MRRWVARQWDDIKGNAKWAAIAAFWWLAVHYGRKMLQLIPNIPSWLVNAVILCFSFLVFLWLARTKQGATGSQIQVPASGPLLPTLSALLGQPAEYNVRPSAVFPHGLLQPSYGGS